MTGNKGIASILIAAACAACVGSPMGPGGNGGGTGTSGGGGGGTVEPGGGGGGTDPGGTTDPGGGGTPVDPPICEQAVPIAVEVQMTPPDVLLVVDKSGSMDEDLDLGGHKWSIMRQAVSDIVMAKNEEINFGLMPFPNDADCGPGTLSATISPMNGTNIVGHLNGIAPEGGTPTHTTLFAAFDYFTVLPVNPNGRYVLLATDGQPNCGGSDGTEPTVAESVEAITALNGLGVKTFVLGFGSGVTGDTTTRQMMATAGGTTTYYSANSPTELQDALNLISSAVTLPSCTYELATAPSDPTKLSVTFDDEPIALNAAHVDGWDYNGSDNSITFYGPACDQLQSGSVTQVGVDYGCGGPIE